MKPIKFLLVIMIAVAGLVASCSTSKLASTTASDDVYNTVAKAREVEYVVPEPQQQQQAQNNQEYDEYYGTSNPYYDMDYSSRINRFYNGYSWRGYYDPYYDNYYYGNSYGNTNFLGNGLGWNNGYGLGGWGGGFGYGFGYGSIWNNPYNYGYFGYSPYGFGGWGPYSYYDRFGWGGGFYGGGYGIGGGYFGGGVYTNNNYRPRPGSNDRGVPRTTNGTVGNLGRPSRAGVNNSNGLGTQGYNPNNNNAGRPTRVQQSNGYSRPQGTQSSRPTRNENYTPQQPQRQESRPTYSAPSNGGGNSGSSGSSSGGGSRPSRAGRG